MGVDKPSRSTWTHLCLWNRRNPLVGHSHLLFDLLVAEHGWCGHLCPIGAIYGVIGAKSLIKIM